MMKNDEFNRTSSSELNSTNSFEFGGGANNNDNIVNNSENLKNSNYDDKINEFGDDLGRGSTRNQSDAFDLEKLQGAADTSAASAATVSVTTAASIATTALVAIVGGITLLTTTVTTEVEVQIDSIVASYNYIDYDISAVGDASSLMINITNGFDNYTASLNEGQNIGQASNLKPNMDYTITITYDDFLVKTTAYKGVITTLSTKEYVTDPDTFSVMSQCQCGVDGYFYFLMDFRDDYKYWSNFEATLTDKDGNVSACVFTENLFDLQKIAVINYDGKYNDLAEGDATLKISCDTKEQKEKLVLCEKTVDI